MTWKYTQTILKGIELPCKHHRHPTCTCSLKPYNIKGKTVTTNAVDSTAVLLSVIISVKRTIQSRSFAPPQKLRISMVTCMYVRGASVAPHARARRARAERAGLAQQQLHNFCRVQSTRVQLAKRRQLV